MVGLQDAHNEKQDQFSKKNSIRQMKFFIKINQELIECRETK